MISLSLHVHSRYIFCLPLRLGVRFPEILGAWKAHFDEVFGAFARCAGFSGCLVEEEVYDEDHKYGAMLVSLRHE